MYNGCHITSQFDEEDPIKSLYHQLSIRCVCVWRRTYRGTARSSGSSNSKGSRLTLTPEKKKEDRKSAHKLLGAPEHFIHELRHFVPRDQI